MSMGLKLTAVQSRLSEAPYPAGARCQPLVLSNRP